MSLRRLLKLKHELDRLELDIRQWGLKLCSLVVNKEGEVGQPFATNDASKNHEGDEVNFDLPLRFDEHEEQEDDDGQSACEKFIISGIQQKFELKRVEISQGFGRHVIEEDQQELRTILFQQGECDGYLLVHPIQPCEINSFGVTLCQIPAWVDLSLPYCLSSTIRGTSCSST
jgi:hypothetical protein